jgi:hypothetical protein
MIFLTDFVLNSAPNRFGIKFLRNTGVGGGLTCSRAVRRCHQPIIAKSFKINRDPKRSPNFHFAVFLSRAIFGLGMNLSLAAKRMTTSTSSIISTTTTSITANGEARN